MRGEGALPFSLDARGPEPPGVLRREQLQKKNQERLNFPATVAYFDNINLRVATDN